MKVPCARACARRSQRVFRWSISSQLVPLVAGTIGLPWRWRAGAGCATRVAAEPSAKLDDDPPRPPPCPGCPRYGEPGIAPAALRRARVTGARPRVARRSGGVRRRRAGSASAPGSRSAGRQGAPKLGMFQLGTHRVVAHPELHRPASTDQSRRRGRAAGAGRCRRQHSTPRPPTSASRAICRSSWSAVSTNRTGRAGRQLPDGRAAGDVPGSDPRAARTASCTACGSTLIASDRMRSWGRRSRTGADRRA